MKKETRIQFKSFLKQQAKLNNLDVSDVATTKFSVEPSIAQKLEKRIQESVAFLQLINNIPVDEQQGSRIGIGVRKSIASTTNTSAGNERKTSGVVDLDGTGYHCKKINYDTHETYEMLDMWAKFKDFQTKYRDALTTQIGLDRITIGFNGTSRSEDSDRVANPLLQDVGVGWLEKLRVNKPESVASDVKVGMHESADYQNLDACVMDTVTENIATWYQEGGDLVVITGRQLLNDKYLSLADQSNSATEKKAFESIATNRTLGGLRVVTVPFFPAKSFAVTSLNNLSIYVQDGSRRRQILDAPKLDRIEDYNSANEDWVVEDYDKMALVDGVLSVDAGGNWS